MSEDSLIIFSKQAILPNQCVQKKDLYLWIRREGEKETKSIQGD